MFENGAETLNPVAAAECSAAQLRSQKALQVNRARRLELFDLLHGSQPDRDHQSLAGEGAADGGDVHPSTTNCDMKRSGPVCAG